MQAKNTLTKENCASVRNALHEVIKIKFQDFTTEFLELNFLLFTLISQKKKEIVTDNDFFLHEAVEHNNRFILHDLLTMNFDINQKNKYGLTAYQVAYALDPIKFAVFRQPRKVSQEISPEKICELKNNPPLIHAVKTGNIDCVNYLLSIPEHPNLPNKVDENGDTLLHLATKTNNIKMIKLLLEKGANPKLCDRRNQDVLTIACKQNNLNILHCYIEYAVNKMDKKNRLHWFHEHDLNPSIILDRIMESSPGMFATTQTTPSKSQQENNQVPKLRQ